MGKLTKGDRLAECDRRMAGHMQELARNWWGMGAVCNEVAAEELYAEGGYASVFDWAQDRHNASRRTVEKSMLVATHFSAQMAERYGTEKLAATVDYLETTKKIEKAGEATALQFRVPQKGGKFQSIPFEKASSADIARARAFVLKARSKSNAPPPPDDDAKKRIVAINAALAPKQRNSPRLTRAVVERTTDGKHRYTFTGIEEDQLEAFARAILASLGRA